MSPNIYESKYDRSLIIDLNHQSNVEINAEIRLFQYSCDILYLYQGVLSHF